MAVALRALGIWKSYAAGVTGCSARVWVLRGAWLEVEPGECVAVLGAPGAGTTTLLHCLAGLRRPDAGRIEASMPPLLLTSDQLADALPEADRPVLVDDGVDIHRRRTRPALAGDRSARRRSILVATHELARVRDVADRILLLHHGRLAPFDRAIPIRRVAERPGS